MDTQVPSAPALSASPSTTSNTVVSQPSIQVPRPRRPWMLIFLLLLLGGIGGFLFSNSLSKPTPVPQPSTVSATSTPTTDPAANWKTYTNQQLDFSLKYPLDTSLKEEGTPPNIFKVIFDQKQVESGKTDAELSNGYIFTVRALGNASTERAAKDSANQMLQASKGTCANPEVAEFSDISTTTLWNKTVYTYQILNCQGDYAEYFVYNNGLVIEITQAYSGDASEKTQYKTILNQILSTFKFLK